MRVWLCSLRHLPRGRHSCANVCSTTDTAAFPRSEWHHIYRFIPHCCLLSLTPLKVWVQTPLLLCPSVLIYSHCAYVSGNSSHMRVPHLKTNVTILSSQWNGSLCDSHCRPIVNEPSSRNDWQEVGPRGPYRLAAPECTESCTGGVCKAGPCLDTAQAQGTQPALHYQRLQHVALPTLTTLGHRVSWGDDQLRDHLSPLWERQVSLPLQKRREYMGPAQKGETGEAFGKTIADSLWGRPLSLWCQCWWPQTLSRTSPGPPAGLTRQ